MFQSVKFIHSDSIKARLVIKGYHVSPSLDGVDDIISAHRFIDACLCSATLRRVNHVDHEVWKGH